VTTPSLKALKDYTDGAEAWRKGDWKLSNELYNSALASDPDFAMAHAALGANYASHWFSRPQDSREHYEKALLRPNRISDREQAYIRVSYARDLGHTDEAIRLSLSYLESYPDDVGERFNLANLLKAVRREDEAIAQFKELLKSDPRDAKSLINLATTYSDRGQFNDAVQYYRKGFDVEPQWITLSNLNNEYGFTLVGAGQEAQAREVFERALQGPQKNPLGLRSLALLDMYHGKYLEAKARLEEAIQIVPGKDYALQRARNSLYLAMADQERGQRAAALGDLKKAERALAEFGQPIPWLGARIGVNYARMGGVAAARTLLASIRPLTDLKNAEQASDLNWLEAEIELAAGNPSRGVTLLEQVERAHTRPLTLDALANAYARAASTDAAIAAYEKLLSTQGGRLGWEAELGWLTAHSRLANLYLLRGEKDKAAKTLDVLLDLWKDADPDLLTLHEARRVRSSIN
jgi:tetratricopeptide (TPR) repeat protein